MTGGYQFLDHMTDAVIEAYGDTLDEAFEQAAKALTDTMVDLRNVRLEKHLEISAQGHDLESLLFDWLDKVLLLLLADRIVLSDFSVRIDKRKDDYVLVGIARGETLDLAKHGYKVEIKAVTYHEMSVVQRDGKATVRFLLDL